MKRYKRLFKESKEDTIKHALFLAKDNPSINRRAFMFMLVLLDKHFNREDIISLAIENYQIHRSIAESLYKQVGSV